MHKSASYALAALLMCFATLQAQPSSSRLNEAIAAISDALGTADSLHIGLIAQQIDNDTIVAQACDTLLQSQPHSSTLRTLGIFSHSRINPQRAISLSESTDTLRLPASYNAVLRCITSCAHARLNNVRHSRQLLDGTNFAALNDSTLLLCLNEMAIVGEARHTPRLLAQLVERNIHNPLMVMQCADLLYPYGQTERIAQILEPHIATITDIDLLRAYADIAWSYYLNDLNEKCCRRLVELGEHDDALATLTQMLFDRGKTDEADHMLSLALNSSCIDPVIRAHMAQIAACHGRDQIFSQIVSAHGSQMHSDACKTLIAGGYAALHDYRTAMKWIDDVVFDEISYSADLAITYIFVAGINSDEPEDHISVIHEIIASIGQDYEPRYLMYAGDLHLACNNTEAAQAFFDAAVALKYPIIDFLSE